MEIRHYDKGYFEPICGSLSRLMTLIKARVTCPACQRMLGIHRAQ